MDKEAKYIAALREIDIRLEKGGDPIADLANVAAVLKKRLDFYWIGFYLLKGDQLVLGPFQGNPACVFLEKGKGVCWASIQRRETILVPDVHAFEGHIACDPKSKSEIAIPLFDVEGIPQGVLDADQDIPNGFDETDRVYLEKVVEKLRTVFSGVSLQ